MFGIHAVTAVRAARRALPLLGLAVTRLLSTLVAPDPALAQGPILRDHQMGGPPTAALNRP
jgi:hypothetical protein